jgi:hypothetical protein
MYPPEESLAWDIMELLQAPVTSWKKLEKLSQK